MMTTMSLALHARHPFFLPRLIGRDDRVVIARPEVTRWLAFGVPAGQTHALPRAQGRMVVHCRSGQAWITHDGYQQDVVLRPNQSYAVACDGRMTAHAMGGDCALALELTAGREPGA